MGIPYLPEINSLKYHYFLGKRIKRKLLVIESDDWGTIRMPSLRTRQFLENQSIDVLSNPFNRLDTLESASDFSALCGVLSTLKDKNGRNPVITADTIMANPDFEAIANTQFTEYHFEHFTETYRRYGYQDAWRSYQQAIQDGFLQPQFHGREHINVQFWLNDLQADHKEWHTAFDRQTFAIRPKGGLAKNYWAAYDFDNQQQSGAISAAIETGLDLFEQTFGMPSVSTIAPVAVWHPEHEKVMYDKGVKCFQTFHIQHAPSKGKDGYDNHYHYMGEMNDLGQMYNPRNCLFEPATNEGFDWVNSCFKQIRYAFLAGKPAVISSHRINYVGGISETNRTNNLRLLRQVLAKVLHAWPDVEFMGSSELYQELKK